MKKRWKKLAALAVTTVMASTIAIGFTACDDSEKEGTGGALKQGTYRTFTSTMPSNWNELTYEDNNDTQILDFVTSSLFTFDYDFGGQKFNEDGTVNASAIVDGGYTVQYDGATKLEDVTATVDAKWGYTAEQKTQGGYAYKITLREDLKWDDGTPIDASDFIYSMKEQLNPKFLNFRANSYYDTIKIKGAYNYLYQGSPLYADIISGADSYIQGEILKDADGNYLLPDGVPAANDDKHIYTSASKPCVFFDGSMSDYYAGGYDDYFLGEYNGTIEDPEKLPDYVVEVKTEEGGKAYYFNYFKWLKDQENEYGYILVNDEVKDALMIISQNFGDGSALSWQEFSFYVSGYGATADWNTVGFYSTGDYELVICMDAPLKMLNDDDSLYYNAAYIFRGLPLVKEDLYESCKEAPVTGKKLWTSKYNSSKETTASWGPYKLSYFQSGKHYTLEKNEHWFGFNMDEYKNQYNVTKIECERIADDTTTWMSFFAGELDSKGIDAAHLDAYKNSKYAVFSPDSTTFGMQIYSGLSALKTNGRNNAILAIPEFKQAMSLALDRGQFATDILAPNQAAYGVLNSQYYYDIDNGGVYRDTQQAKESLLRAYGYTKAEDGTWSNASGTITGYPTDDAYETLGGSNMTKAKALVQAAYEKLTAPDNEYGYDSNKDIEILIGWSAPSTTYTNTYNYFKSAWEKMVEGTPLQGKIKVTYDENRGSAWADDFKAGKYDISPLSGVGGNPLNPYDVIRCYIDPNYSLNYHKYWDTNNIDLTITFGEDSNEKYSGKTLTMSALNWYCCLNGVAETYAGKDGYSGVTHKDVMSAGYLDESNRLLILAALEELVLNQYNFVPLVSDYTAALLGAKFSYISNEYNMFLGFGGMRYMTVNYTDSEWDAFVATFGTSKLEEFYKVSD